MDRGTRGWPRQEEAIVGEKLGPVSAFQDVVEHHADAHSAIPRRSVIPVPKRGAGATAEPAGSCRFVFATGVEEPKEVAVEAHSIAEAKVSARALYPNAELRRIQHRPD